MLAIMSFMAAQYFKVNLEELETVITRGTGILIALGGLSAAMKMILPETAKKEVVIVPADSIHSGEGGATTPPKV